jgi:hypothetical protein
MRFNFREKNWRIEGNPQFAAFPLELKRTLNFLYLAKVNQSG